MKKKDCSCPRCEGVPTADPVYGYDRAKVPGINCGNCKEPIGQEEFVEIDGIARFGIMSFVHKRCFTKKHKCMLSKKKQKELSRAK